MTKPVPLGAVPTPRTGPDLTPEPPHSIEAEQHVLGAVMLSPVALAEVRPLLDAADFYRPAHAQIWEAVCALADRGAPADPLAVGAHIGARSLARVGGAPYLHTLIAQVPAAANATYYAHLVRDYAYRRQVAAAGVRLCQLAEHDPGESVLSIGELRATVAAEVGALTAPDVRGWAEPTPLSATPELPAFPIWCLPGWAGEYAASVAEATQTPVDLAGCLALTVLAVAAAGNVWVHSGWDEPTNLMVLVVLPPGNRKSEVYKLMTAPIRHAEQVLIEAAQSAIATATVKRRVAEENAKRAEDNATAHPEDAQLADLAADARLAVEQANVPAKPRLFGGNDSTTEKVQNRLDEQNGRYAVLAPEGGKLFSIAAGRYSGNVDIGVFLSGHAGEEIRSDRMGREGESIEHATLTIGVCLQPDVLAGLGDTPEFRGQGLLGRLLISIPESLLGRRNPTPQPIPPHAEAEYHQTLGSLATSLRVHGEPGNKPITLTCTPDAQNAVTGLLAAVEPRLDPATGDLAYMTDWAGKYVGAIVRIAALLHLGKHLRDGYERPIDTATITDATQLGEYFLTHAQAAYDAIGADPAVNHARTIHDWIHRTKVTRFTARDLMRGPLKNRVRKVTETDAPLRVLETHGWIRRLPAPPITGRGNPPATAYETHPDLTQDPDDPDLHPSHTVTTTTAGPATGTR